MNCDQITKFSLSWNSLWFFSLNRKIAFHYESSKYKWILLLLCSDVEKNPGPVEQINYNLGHPCLCGFYRSAICNVLMGMKLLPKKDSVSTSGIEEDEGINDAKQIFGDHFNMMSLNFLEFRKDRIIKCIKNWGKNRGRENKGTYFKTFSAANWLKLDLETRNKHSVFCSECENSYIEIHAMYPANSRTYSKEKERLNLLIHKFKNGKVKEVCENVKPNLKRLLSESLSHLQSGNNNAKISKKTFKTFSLEVGEVLDQCYQEHSNDKITFFETYSKGKHLVSKPTYEEKRKFESHVTKKVVDKIQSYNDKNSDIRFYAGGYSGRSWERDRKRKAMEGSEEARNRSELEAGKIRDHKKKPKDHTGKFSSYNINTTELLSLASSWDDTTKVNWSLLGKKFVLCGKENKVPKNSGQIVKKFLLQEEAAGRITLNFLNKDQPLKPRIRKAYKKVAHNISVPIESSLSKIKAQKDVRVSSGEIDTGENVVERTYQKLSIQDGEIVSKTFSVKGRKIPLLNIRKTLLHQYHKYMRLNSDAFFDSLEKDKLAQKLQAIGEFIENEDLECMRERAKNFERTRNFLAWHDGSSIANHGHILISMNILYDPAVFFTSAEWKEKYGEDIDIQSIVETPELYIIGRCRSNDEQLGYIDTRIKCLKELETNLNVREIVNSQDKNIKIADVMRMFTGDLPAVALESGNQKGGFYFCPSCDIHICQTDDISGSFQKNIRSLAFRQKEVLKGKFGKMNSLKKQTNPFENLTAEEMKQELMSRDIDISHLKVTKKELGVTLKKSLKGIKRVPALLMQDPIKDLQELQLGNYEIAMLEPMHDIANHIENILEELPHHLKEPHKSTFVMQYSVLKAEKERKRCCDWRRILLFLTHSLYHKIDGKVHRLLKTLSEIQRILYMNDELRTPKEILRLHTSCFEHFILLKSLIDINKLSSGITRDRLFGKYAHNLLVHAPIQYRLLACKSIAAERQECMFHTAQEVTTSKTNNRPDHIIENMVLRMQYKKLDQSMHDCESSKSSTINNDIKSLGKHVSKIQNNTVIEYEYIRPNPFDLEAFLQTISGYLIFGEGCF